MNRTTPSSSEAQHKPQQKVPRPTSPQPETDHPPEYADSLFRQDRRQAAPGIPDPSNPPTAAAGQIAQRAIRRPAATSPADSAVLQRAYGNQLTTRLLTGGFHPSPTLPIQARLKLHQFLTQHEEPPSPATLPAQEAGRADSGNDRALPDPLKAGIESLSGLSMDDVTVHYNSIEPTRVHALAYAEGTNIHIAPGQEAHLPHEAWHVVQQKQGRVQPTMQLKDVAINDDTELEQEADVMGARAVQSMASGREPAVPSPAPQAPVQRAADNEPQAQLLQFASFILEQQRGLLTSPGAPVGAPQVSEEQMAFVVQELQRMAAGDVTNTGLLEEIQTLIQQGGSHQPSLDSTEVTQRVTDNGGSHSGKVVQRNAISLALIPVGILGLIYHLFQRFQNPRSEQEQEGSGSKPESGAAGNTNEPQTGRGKGKKKRKEKRKKAPDSTNAPTISSENDEQQTETGTKNIEYKKGDLVDLEDANAVQKFLDKENEKEKGKYQVALNLHKTFEYEINKYRFNREKNYVPTPHGGHIGVNTDGGRVQPYRNDQGLFPALPNLHRYKEYDVGAGIGTPGNYRLVKIEPENYLYDGKYNFWVGYNFTHSKTNWIRVWNDTGKYWEKWNPDNHTGTSLPDHVAQAPNDPLSAEQKALLKEGWVKKELKQQGFQFVVEENRQKSL